MYVSSRYTSFSLLFYFGTSCGRKFSVRLLFVFISTSSLSSSCQSHLHLGPLLLGYLWLLYVKIFLHSEIVRVHLVSPGCDILVCYSSKLYTSIHHGKRLVKNLNFVHTPPIHPPLLVEKYQPPLTFYPSLLHLN